VKSKLLPKHKRLFYSLICILLFSGNSFGQDIEPRRWTSLPQGTNIFSLAYVHTDGDLYFDPILDVEDARINVNSFALSYVRPIKIGNKMARLDFLQVYSRASWEGLLGGQPTTINRNGLLDPRIRMSINLLGPSAMTPLELRDYYIANPTNTTIGLSVALKLPLGQYFEDKLINLGNNRFMIRPQLGLIHNWGKWSYELTGSIFLFTNNDDFLVDKLRKQDPIFAIQTHLLRHFKHGIWISLSGAYGGGGASNIDNVDQMDPRENIVAALAISKKLSKSQSIRASYLYSETQKSLGADLNTFSLIWTFIFY
jgi:hypothetical protein